MTGWSRYAYNNSDSSFVLADSCTGSNTSTGCAGYTQTATYSGTGLPTDYPCTGIKLAGISACVGSSGPEKGANSGEVCLCKITYPKEGVWVFISIGVWGGKCANQCANLCGCHMANDANSQQFRNAMIGGAL
jgi:hypothetical protein